MKIILFLIVFGVLFGVGLYYFNLSRVPKHLYKVVTKKTWEQSKDNKQLELPEFDREFIHLATKEQLPKIISKFFAGQSDILVLKLDAQKLPGKLIKEKNPGGATEYYHLYDGAILKDAIVEVIKR